jgi:formylglycine-generating enzyme required for sulfatase activity
MAALQWAYDNGHVTATSGSVTDNLDGSSVELVDLDGSGSEIAFSGGVFVLANAGHGAANGDHPVKEISWYGAVAYCDWLSMIDGLPRAYDHSTWECNGGNPYGATGYRLPTDAEWEYAAQYNDERIYPWGSEVPDCSRANHYWWIWGCGVFWTSPVGSYPGGPEILGELLYDMAGNVWEWCNDRHTCSLGTVSATNPAGPSSGAYRVIRGGGWFVGVDYLLRCANRNYDSPSYPGSRALGFRCARSQ